MGSAHRPGSDNVVARLEASFMTGGLAIRAIALLILLLVLATWQAYLPTRIQASAS